MYGVGWAGWLCKKREWWRRRGCSLVLYSPRYTRLDIDQPVASPRLLLVNPTACCGRARQGAYAGDDEVETRQPCLVLNCGLTPFTNRRPGMGGRHALSAQAMDSLVGGRGRLCWRQPPAPMSRSGSSALRYAGCRVRQRAEPPDTGGGMHDGGNSLCRLPPGEDG